MQTQGKKEIKEAVLIGALVAIGGQIVAWTFEEAKAAVNRRRERRVKQKEEVDKEEP